MNSLFKLTSLLLFTGFSNLALSQNPVLIWNNNPGGVAITKDHFENVFTASWDFNPMGDITLTKRDSSGNILWQDGFDNTDISKHEVATWVAADQEGNCFVSGTIRSGISNPVNVNSVLMKFGSDGSLIWRRIFDSEFDGSYSVKCIVDNLGNAYVLSLGNSGNGMKTQVKKFSSEGISTWTYFDTTGIGLPQNIKLTKDNHLLIIGRNSTGFINGYSKLDLNGNLVWSITGINSATVGDAATDNWGNTYLVNGNNQLVNPLTLIRKLSPDANLLWEIEHPMTAIRTEVGPDNLPVISGYPNSGSPGVAIAKIDSTGEILWTNLNADGSQYALLAQAMMKIDSLGSTYVAGGTMSAMGICKVDANGSFQWAVSAPNGYPSGFELTEHGAIYMVGGTTLKFGQNNIITSEEKLNNEFHQIFPNPSSIGQTIFLKNEQASSLNLYTISGKLIWSATKLSPNDEIEIPINEPGLFFLEIIRLNGENTFHKLIKN